MSEGSDDPFDAEAGYLRLKQAGEFTLGERRALVVHNTSAGQPYFA
jgi:hypothetical protein